MQTFSSSINTISLRMHKICSKRCDPRTIQKCHQALNVFFCFCFFFLWKKFLCSAEYCPDLTWQEKGSLKLIDQITLPHKNDIFRYVSSILWKCKVLLKWFHFRVYQNPFLFGHKIMSNLNVIIVMGMLTVSRFQCWLL